MVFVYERDMFLKRHGIFGKVTSNPSPVLLGKNSNTHETSSVVKLP